MVGDILRTTRHEAFIRPGNLLFRLLLCRGLAQLSQHAAEEETGVRQPFSDKEREFSEYTGYIHSCTTNLSVGMRASVYMDLCKMLGFFGNASINI